MMILFFHTIVKKHFLYSFFPVMIDFVFVLAVPFFPPMNNDENDDEYDVACSSV